MNILVTENQRGPPPHPPSVGRELEEMFVGGRKGGGDPPVDS